MALHFHFLVRTEMKSLSISLPNTLHCFERSDVRQQISMTWPLQNRLSRMPARRFKLSKRSMIYLPGIPLRALSGTSCAKGSGRALSVTSSPGHQAVEVHGGHQATSLHFI